MSSQSEESKIGSKRLLGKAKERLTSVLASVLGEGVPKEVATEVLLTKKRVFNGVVLPTMMVASIFFLVFYFSIPLLAFVLGGAVVNVFLTKKERTLRLFGRTYSTRSDVADLLRWSFNFIVIDFSELFIAKPSGAAVMAFWMAISLAAMIDIGGAVYRIASIIVSAVTLTVVLFVVCSSTTANAVFAIFGILVVSAFFVALENFLVSSLVKLRDGALREAEGKGAMERLKTEAAIGARVRFVFHELNNALFTFEFLERVAVAKKDQNLPNVQGLTERIRRVTDLLLPGAGAQPGLTATPVSALQEAVKMACDDGALPVGVSISLSFSPEVEELFFSEYFGAAALVIINVVRNGVDAAHEALEKRARSTARVDVRCELADGSISIHVEDQGLGISEDMRKALLAGTATTTKRSGHGVGFRIVREECIRNGFQLDIHPAAHGGTVVSIVLPLAPGKKSEHPPASIANGRR